MQFSPCLYEAPGRDGALANVVPGGGLLQGRERALVADHVAAGGALGVVLLEIQDFSLLRRLVRPD
ncbi:MAG TPA: hypothetical protein PKD41_12520, partial [Solidesulfovibrio sp.]|nr:hypothetical protein [Desulfovibrio sp.]HML61713.1 hypothetical protein [Solidesulfovibrio sp.]